VLLLLKHGLVDNDGMPIIEPNTLARMKDDDVRMDFGVGSDKEVRMSKDSVVGKLNNLIAGLSTF
jgi:hypothetical protein